MGLGIGHDGSMNSPGQRHAGERVQLARAQLGLNQNELADKAGVNPTTVSFLETGKRWPRVKSQLGITRALGWPDGELERLARSYVPERLDDDRRASVSVLEGALSAGEAFIMNAGLDPVLAAEMVKAWREAGLGDLIAEYAARQRRARNG